MADQLCLQVSGVGKRYGGLEVLAGITLNVREGVRQAILGPNGAGKTTLFRILSGEIAPSRGTVSFRGRDITNAPPYRRVAMGIARTFQTTTLFPRLTVLQNVVLAVQGTRRAKYVPCRLVERIAALNEEARRTVDRVGLAGREAVTVGALAYGEQRQLEIGLALACRPSLLLLDEPTAGLARAEVSRIVALLHDLPRDITILLIEHDMDVAFALAETVTVLNQGQVLAEGPLDTIRANARVQEIYLGGI
jgi:branched-chain amino acid transport system ATP-binding protein